MDALKRLAISAFFMTSVVAGADGVAQTTVPINDIQKQLLQFYTPAKATADGTDLVTAGSVLVLQKDNLLMDAVDQQIPSMNTYNKDKGAITNGAVALKGLKAFSSLMSHLPGADQLASASGSAATTAGADATRTFVAGEKFFVTKIDTRPDSVVFAFISDPIKDVRYHATLKFPFPKGAVPTPDDVAALVSEVIKVDDSSQEQQSASNQPNQGDQKGAAAAPETKTIAIGQTRDQVVAMLGVPTKVVQLGAKEIDIFPDLKVTFVQSKVVDVK